LEERADSKPITLGISCWVGMNSVILPGVSLGDHTIVGAGSVVTKSFPDGFCVIAGNPAKLIRDIRVN
jgi:acetyltransferase-like isoleucine patch superfamily enzyme